jgi:hypothetical protein
MSCECINWSIKDECIADNNFMFHNHHPKCDGYKTDKIPRLFYYEDALGYWTPAPDKVEHLLVVTDQLDNEEKMSIEFQRVDMTQCAYDLIPVD